MTRSEICMKLAKGQLTAEQAEQLLAANDPAPNKLTLKVSRKGAVQVNGMGRFPVTLYIGQWERLQKFMDELLAFGHKYEKEDFSGESAESEGGPKTKYTARVVRK